MAIWKEQTTGTKDAAPITPVRPAPTQSELRPDLDPSYDSPRRSNSNADAHSEKESVIAAGLTIQGQIEGAGSVRIAGNFQGDVHVKGNLTIEPGAKLTGGVRAATVIIGGELEGNIDQAQRVELLQSGVLNGNLNAGSLTVAAGSRMRGQAEFGWEGKQAARSDMRVESGSAA
ncbi:MAG TPA: polymer-forming cytoskeletal protein [Gemmatimonadaceae bacterium]|nr:polymer-forming cytoskeletal protein [Gemmatimonadaceae bacterium]